MSSRGSDKGDCVNLSTENNESEGGGSISSRGSQVGIDSITAVKTRGIGSKQAEKPGGLMEECDPPDDTESSSELSRFSTEGENVLEISSTSSAVL